MNIYILYSTQESLFAPLRPQNALRNRVGTGKRQHTHCSNISI